jgi:hypothetical protein
MKVRALRGVCYGIGRHLHPDGADGADKEADLDPNTASYLINIGAVEAVPDVVVQEVIPEEKPRKRKSKDLDSETSDAD